MTGQRMETAETTTPPLSPSAPKRGGDACAVPAWPYPRMSQAPLVGRDAELDACSRAFTTAIEGSGGVLVIRGEAGVGKTRLADAVLRGRQVHASGEPGEALVLRGKATEREAPLAYEAFLAALRQLRRLRGLLSLERCSPRLMPYRPALAALLPEWRVGLPPHETAPGDRYFLFEGIAELFSELIDVEPLCLYLDDAQWMDEGSVELISYLARTLRDRPYVFLLGIRDGETPYYLESLLSELRGVGPFASWTLRRLDREATATLSATWLGVEPEQIEAALAKRLYTETQGNPFFLQEVIAALVETGALRRDDERVVVRENAAPVLPSGILASVQRRLTYLPATLRTALEASAVIGEIVEVDLLRRTLARPMEEILIVLDELERRCFLAPDDRSPERSVRFVHPKIREAVYSSLLLEQRFHWHREAARVLETLPEAHPARSMTAIATHLSLAEDAERAIPLLISAGEKAMATALYAEAAWHFARAARHLEQLKPGTREAEGGESPLPLARWEGELLLMRGHLFWAEGRQTESVRSFLNAWELLRDVEDPAAVKRRTEAALFYADALFNTGDVAASKRQMEACRPLIEAAPKEWRLWPFFQRRWGHVLAAEGDHEGAYQALREGLRQAIDLRDEELITEFAQAIHEEAVSRGDLADAQVTETLIRERATVSRKPSLLFHRAHVEHVLARSQGDWATARQKVEEMHRVMAAIDHRTYMAVARTLLLRLQARSDPTAVWLSLCREAVAAVAAGDVTREAEVGALQAVSALERNDLAEAAAAAEATLVCAQRVPRRVLRANVLETIVCCLAEIACRGGRPGDARRWLEDGDPAGARPSDLWVPLRRDSLTAWAAALGGEAKPARAALDRVAAGIPRVGESWLRGIIMGEAAQAARLLGDDDQARRLQAEAFGLLEHCGATGRVAYLGGGLEVETALSGGEDPPTASLEASQEMLREPMARGGITPPPAPSPKRRRGLDEGIADAGADGKQLAERNGTGGESSRSALAPGLRIRLLGGFEVWRGAERVTYEVWGSRKARNLFKYLALQRGRPVLMDELLEMFWPELPLESAGHALRTTLHRIRRVLEPNRPPRHPSTYLRVAEDAVHFPAEGQIWLDVGEFEARLREAMRREVSGQTEGALHGLREALDIYTGDLLPEDRYEEWSLVPREQLQERCREALSRLWRAAVEAGAHEEALRLGERMLELDPCSDDGVQWLLRALDALGRRTEAARRFDQFARRLDRELGMEPEAETRRLIEKIKGKS